MNTAFQQAIAKLQVQVAEEKAPQPEVEKVFVGKQGITSRRLSENIFEVGQIVKR